jgi:hypothetical protein
VDTKHEQSILHAYKSIIGVATKYIYIENQYFISPAEDSPNEIMDALLKRLNEVSDLKVVVVLPLFPDGKYGGIGGSESVLYW